MELTKIFEIMSAPEKIIDPSQCNLLSSYIGGFVTDLEEQLNEENYMVSVEWGKLREELKSNAEADRGIELTDIYRKREKTKLLLAKLKRFRADVKDRFLVLTNQKRFS